MAFLTALYKGVDPRLLSDDINAVGIKRFRTYAFDGYGHAAYDLAPNDKKILFGFFEE